MKDNLLSKIPSTTVKPSNGDMAPAPVEALSPMPKIKPIKHILASTPIIPDKTKTDTMTHPNSPDTVSENLTPPIIILENDEARTNTMDTVPTQAITEPEVMEVVDLTIDKSKTPSDGTMTPAKIDAPAPPPENQSIKQAETNTPAIRTRPKSPDTVSSATHSSPNASHADNDKNWLSTENKDVD